MERERCHEQPSGRRLRRFAERPSLHPQPAPPVPQLASRHAEASLAGLDGPQLDRFEALLECSDADLFDWIIGSSTPPPAHQHDVMRLLRSFNFRQTKG